jgi:putative exosortase-associated protein (TIGR04073 family)
MRRWRIVMTTLVVSLGLGAAAAPGAAWAESKYTPARKVGRGFANTTMGVVAIPGQMYKQSKERGAAIGVPLGFVMGIGWFVASELVGVYEILTCPFELPKEYRPILQPEFPWEYFE